MICVTCSKRLPDGEMILLMIIAQSVSVAQVLCSMDCLIEHVAATQSKMLGLGS